MDDTNTRLVGGDVQLTFYHLTEEEQLKGGNSSKIIRSVSLGLKPSFILSLICLKFFTRYRLQIVCPIVLNFELF